MKKINWSDHLVNLIVVILGISIAFYLESWRENKRNKELEQQYLISLASDLQNDRDYLDTLLVINENIEKSLRVTSGASIGRPFNEDSLLGHIFSIQYIPPFKPQKVTYESLKSTGNLDLIRKFEVRKRVIELYEQFYRGSQEFDQAITDHTQNYIQPYFIKNFIYTGPGKVQLELLQDNQLRNMLFSEQNIAQMRSSFYKQVDEELNAVIDIVNKEIED